MHVYCLCIVYSVLCILYSIVPYSIVYCIVYCVFSPMYTVFHCVLFWCILYCVLCFQAYGRIDQQPAMLVDQVRKQDPMEFINLTHPNNQSRYFQVAVMIAITSRASLARMMTCSVSPIQVVEHAGGRTSMIPLSPFAMINTCHATSTIVCVCVCVRVCVISSHC